MLYLALLFMISIIFLFLSLTIMYLSNLLMSKAIHNMFKLSAFECGFQSFSKLRFPFSLRFFLVALIFLIFDIEIIFVFPFSMHKSSLYLPILSFFFLMFIIFYGLIHEWYFGSLNWSY